MAGLGHDFDDVAVAQPRTQRDDAPVHLGAHAPVPHVGVNGVSEIDGRGVARQHDHFAPGRERVGLFGVQVHLQRGHELAGVLHLPLPLHQVPQPGDALIVRRWTLAALLVFPVGGDAFLRDAVHLLGADLHLERLTVRADHGSMQRLVEVGTRNGDEVLDAARDGAPLVVDHAQRGVAVLHRIGDDAQRRQVVDLVEEDLLPPHLLEHRIGPLQAPVDAVGQLDHDDADILHHGQQHLADALRLPVLGGEEIQLGQLGDAVHAACHFLAELLAHLLDGDAGIFHHVVQQAGLHGDQVHPHLRQNAGHADGVRHVRLSRIAHLPFMPLTGEAEGLFQRRQIVLGPVSANLGLQLAVRLLHRIGRMQERQRFRNAWGLGGHATSIVARWDRPSPFAVCHVSLKGGRLADDKRRSSAPP